MERFLVEDLVGFARLALPKGKLLPKENPIYEIDTEIQQMRATTLVKHTFNAKLWQFCVRR